MQARKDMLIRVHALVDRARATAAQLAESQKREKALIGDNEKLRQQLDSVERVIADLNGNIERQAMVIATLTAKADSLDVALNDAKAAESRAYYFVGREDELIKKGVIVKEGGANLIVKRVGRTTVPARELNRELFTQIDTRAVQEIAMPDTTHRYMIVSRQSLDEAAVNERDKSTFTGNLRITHPDQFWAASRYLIIVQR